MFLNLADWYLIVVLILSVFYSVILSYKNAGKLNSNNNTLPSVLMFALAIGVALWLGLRPVNSSYGDTYLYALMFNDHRRTSHGWEGDWGFDLLTEFCRSYVDVSGFFVIIALDYFLFIAYAMKKLLNCNDYGGFLFFLGSFSTFSYATNGIRNGLACSIITLAIVLIALKDNVKSIILAGIVSFLALSIHKSTILPLICLGCAILIKNQKIPFYFWIASIFIFLTLGNIVGNFLSSLGFDDRMSSYLSNTSTYALSNKSGFRPDFLLYSAMPIVLGYYIIFKKGIYNRTYSILLNTYILSNAMWVMIMDIAYSNRFAYLSWFLYPIVLAYPCFEMNIWNRSQGKMAANILLLNVLFTVFMHFIYY